MSSRGGSLPAPDFADMQEELVVKQRTFIFDQGRDLLPRMSLSARMMTVLAKDDEEETLQALLEQMERCTQHKQPCKTSCKA